MHHLLLEDLHVSTPVWKSHIAAALLGRLQKPTDCSRRCYPLMGNASRLSQALLTHATEHNNTASKACSLEVQF
jgi:hypothetical protein